MTNSVNSVSSMNGVNSVYSVNSVSSLSRGATSLSDGILLNIHFHFNEIVKQKLEDMYKI